jgi:hypothetical protein
MLITFRTVFRCVLNMLVSRRYSLLLSRYLTRFDRYMPHLSSPNIFGANMRQHALHPSPGLAGLTQPTTSRLNNNHHYRL